MQCHLAPQVRILSNQIADLKKTADFKADVAAMRRVDLSRKPVELSEVRRSQMDTLVNTSMADVAVRARDASLRQEAGSADVLTRRSCSSEELPRHEARPAEALAMDVAQVSNLESEACGTTQPSRLQNEAQRTAQPSRLQSERRRSASAVLQSCDTAKLQAKAEGNANGNVGHSGGRVGNGSAGSAQLLHDTQLDDQRRYRPDAQQCPDFGTCGEVHQRDARTAEDPRSVRTPDPEEDVFEYHLADTEPYDSQEVSGTLGFTDNDWEDDLLEEQPDEEQLEELKQSQAEAELRRSYGCGGFSCRDGLMLRETSPSAKASSGVAAPPPRDALMREASPHARGSSDVASPPPAAQSRALGPAIGQTNWLVPASPGVDRRAPPMVPTNQPAVWPDVVQGVRVQPIACATQTLALDDEPMQERRSAASVRGARAQRRRTETLGFTTDDWDAH